MSDAETLPSEDAASAEAPVLTEHAERLVSPETLRLRQMVQMVAADYLIESKGWVQDQVNAPDKVDYLRGTIYNQLDDRLKKEDRIMTRFIDAADAARVRSPFDILISAIRVGAKADGTDLTPTERIEKFTETFIV